ncbi:unnamed protein product [Phyllotreta striolata]|uniref:G-protein coupled receptors family 1 profile domain-containing protein n=1 Tax=Phyllotreta striolata TaxID=444603 RepID=A0A9N9U1C9_PHYSR|nr:unnamed protein product [Phyllotreta striolata]
MNIIVNEHLQLQHVLGTMETNDSSTIDGNATFVDTEQFKRRNFREIAFYTVLFVVAAIGNLTVFVSLLRSRRRKSRISLMITHLTIADLIVTFIMIPGEVIWRLTGVWLAGNVACKVFLFLRVLGPYLSSNILVCISLDRYFAVLYPLRVTDARRRGKLMLSVAWSASIAYCIPQSFVFSVQTHPDNSNFTQCVSYYFFSSPSQETAYNFLCVIFMYFLPLSVITVAYTAIMCELSRNSKIVQNESLPLADGKLRLRRSAVSNIEKAKSRTLKMTITIVAVYVACCTPTAIMTLWYMVDRTSAEGVPDWLQEFFFIMVATNSCMNPIIYGSYIIKCNRTCQNASQAHRKPNENLNDGEIRSTYASKDVVRRLLKCFLRHGKDGSATTKSTAAKKTNALYKNESLALCKIGQSQQKEDRTHSGDYPPSAARVSFAESTASNHSQGLSYYSEPLTNQLGLGSAPVECKRSQPDLCTTTSLVMNVHQVKVQYHRRGDQRNELFM